MRRARAIEITICVMTSVMAPRVAPAQRAPAQRGVRECLGTQAPLLIRADRIGQLPLDLSLRDILARCPSAQWSTVNGDESLDTAIVLSQHGIRVVGAVGTLEDTDGSHRPLHVDVGRPIKWWRVTGDSAELPHGLPLTATWFDAARTYGALHAFALNGTVYVTICRQPGLTLLMDIPSPTASINGEPERVVNSVMATSRIQGVLLSVPPSNHTAGC